MKFKLSRVALTTMSLLPLLTACGENETPAHDKENPPRSKPWMYEPLTATCGER